MLVPSSANNCLLCQRCVCSGPRALYYICNMYYDISFMGFSLLPDDLSIEQSARRSALSIY